jgi:hypothetical protein
MMALRVVGMKRSSDLLNGTVSLVIDRKRLVGCLVWWKSLERPVVDRMYADG